ncbi:hypothetical protein GJAV_G00009810 [Gymnothorax javanicus]|nr:hypothetical protein GJAV_G00009810 [Gymnothorax javanicus]
MASTEGSSTTVAGVQANAQELHENESYPQLLKDLDSHLVELENRTELCDQILRDLVDLRGILVDKKYAETGIQSTVQNHSH